MNYISYLLTQWGIKASFVPALAFIIAFLIIVAFAYMAHIAFKIYIHRQINKYVNKKKNAWGTSLLEANLVQRLSHLVPALIIYSAVPLLAASTLVTDVTIIRGIQSVMLLYILWAFIRVFNSVVYMTENTYSKQRGRKRKSIKSYLQVIRIIVYFFSAILAVSIVINKSPVALFTGLGVIAAGLSFVFRDTIIGFVSSVQVSSYDMVREGDWITMPKYGADGDVIEINLNTVKIQNFDKTITTVPTHALLTEGVTNWRGMEESGGRRIKSSVKIDITTIKFCNEALLDKLSKIDYLKKLINSRLKENEKVTQDENETVVFERDKLALTNLGLFRAYLDNYLRNHQGVHGSGYTFLIRYLEATEYGLPVQIYVFTNDTEWAQYETIQAGIFEHIFSIINEFELKVFQRK